MKKICIVFVLAALVCCFSGCNPEEIKTSCIEMVNTSNNAYKIYIDDVEKGYITGQNYEQYLVTPKTHKVKVVQQDGYALWPTTETYLLDCEIGCTTTKEFPESSLGKSAEN